MPRKRIRSRILLGLLLTAIWNYLFYFISMAGTWPWWAASLFFILYALSLILLFRFTYVPMLKDTNLTKSVLAYFNLYLPLSNIVFLALYLVQRPKNTLVLIKVNRLIFTFNIFAITTMAILYNHRPSGAYFSFILTPSIKQYVEISQASQKINTFQQNYDKELCKPKESKLECLDSFYKKEVGLNSPTKISLFMVVLNEAFFLDLIKKSKATDYITTYDFAKKHAKRVSAHILNHCSRVERTYRWYLINPLALSSIENVYHLFKASEATLEEFLLLIEKRLELLTFKKDDKKNILNIFRNELDNQKC